MRQNFCLALSLLVTVDVNSFQIQRQQQQKSTTTRLFSETYLLSLDKTSIREVDQFQQWAAQYGVQPETGFSLRGDVVFGIEDWYAVTNTGGAQGSRVLYVPGEWGGIYVIGIVNAPLLYFCTLTHNLMLSNNVPFRSFR